jgi:CelD/BcsL family acetyltransferase involved in cellulose biosynthesis
MASSRETERFYTEVAHHAATRGTLVLTTLRVDGHLAAFDLGVEQGDILYSLKVAYDHAYRKGSPGIVVTHEAVRQAFGSDCSRYDWLGSDEPWKDLWTDDHVERARLLLLAPTLVGRMTSFAIANGHLLPDPLVAQGKAVARRVLRR